MTKLIAYILRLFGRSTQTEPTPASHASMNDLIKLLGTSSPCRAVLDRRAPLDMVALYFAGQILGEQVGIDAAERVATYILENV